MRILILDGKEGGDILFRRIQQIDEVAPTVIYEATLVSSFLKKSDLIILGSCPELLATEPNLLAITQALCQQGFTDKILVVGESVKPPAWMKELDPERQYCLRHEAGKRIKAIPKKQGS